jgi:hypothetical protein
VKVTDCPDAEGLSDEPIVVVVDALLTVCDRAALVLVLKFVSPAYTAVIVGWAPTLSVLVLKVAVFPVRVPVPSVVAPSLKVTMPLGVPAPGEVTLTVAVNVTDCPKTDGVPEEATVVVVAALLTVWVRAELALPVKLTSPL